MSAPEGLAAVASAMYWLASRKAASLGWKQYPVEKKIVDEYSSSESSNCLPRQVSVGWKFSYWMILVTY